MTAWNPYDQRMEDQRKAWAYERAREIEARPTEYEASVAFWAELRAAAASRPEPPQEPRKGRYRCAVDGEQLTEERCRKHLEERPIPWPAAMARAWHYARQEPVLADPDRDGWDERLWVGTTRGELAMAIALRERWGGLPEEAAPVVIPDIPGRRGLFGGRI